MQLFPVRFILLIEPKFQLLEKQNQSINLVDIKITPKQMLGGGVDTTFTQTIILFGLFRENVKAF